jgi:hypothetical protein
MMRRHSLVNLGFQIELSADQGNPATNQLSCAQLIFVRTATGQVSVFFLLCVMVLGVDSQRNVL